MTDESFEFEGRVTHRFSATIMTPDRCNLCCAGRPDILQEETLWLWRPRRGSVLLFRLWQQAQQPVFGPERTHTVPQRSILAVRLPAVSLHGPYTEPHTLTHIHMYFAKINESWPSYWVTECGETGLLEKTDDIRNTASSHQHEGLC